MRHGAEDMNTTDGMFKVKLGYEGKMRSSGEGGRWGGRREEKVMEGLNLTVGRNVTKGVDLLVKRCVSPH